MSSVSYSIEAKSIDDLQEVGKLSGGEKTLISVDADTKKVSIDTIVGYAANLIAQSLSGNTAPVMMASNLGSSGGNCIITVPEGEEIPINLRTPGTYYIEKTKQTSIRTKMNVPTSVVVSSTLGLKRV